MLKEDNAQTDIRLHKIKEGFLVKRSRILKQWKKRWMVLTRTHLYSFQNKGLYRSPTEKIPLKEVSTIKSFYKNQYQRPHVFRIESDDTYFYLSAQDHQDKWAWMTAVQKMTEAIRNPITQDSQNLIRQTLRMSTAVRQSTLIPRKSGFNQESLDLSNDIIKKLKLKLDLGAINCHIPPSHSKNPKFSISKLQPFQFQGIKLNNSQQTMNKNNQQSKIIERIVEIEKIVEVRVPYQVQKIVEREKIVIIKENSQNSGGNLYDLFAALINCKLDDPKPLLDFVAFLGLSGIQKYQAVALQFCCERDCHRFFAQLLLQALNEQIIEERLNRYTAFIYILCQREIDYFYSSDLRILTQIVVRQLQLYRSDLNQMINLQLIRVLLTYHLKTIAHKGHDIRVISAEIANLGAIKNRQIAQQICLLLQ